MPKIKENFVFKSVNKEFAKQVLAVVDKGLSCGLGSTDDNCRPIPGEICVEAAVSFAMGEYGLDDHPGCVGVAIRSLKIAINDCENVWDSNKARAKSLRRLAIAQLGSDRITDARFNEALQDMIHKKYVPVDVRKLIGQINSTVIDLQGDIGEQVSELNYLTEQLGEALETLNIKDRDVDTIVNRLFWWRKDKARKKTVDEFCENVVQVLIDLKSPGTKYLYLTEE